jgi:hypothetical protein
MKQFIFGVTMGLLIATGVAGFAQQAVQPPQQAAPQTVPEWVVRYAGNQEQATRACQMQLAQEQFKIETLTKELADAKNALAAAKPEKPKEK